MDDNSTNLRILEKTLKHHFSHLVDTSNLVHAVDGEKALQAYHESSYDLILLDIDMPHMSGVQVAEVIRRTDRDIIIIACTTSDSVASRELYTSVGMDGCVSKPLDLRALNDSLVTSLRSRPHLDLHERLSKPHRPERTHVHRKSAPASPVIISRARFVERAPSSSLLSIASLEEALSTSDSECSNEAMLTASVDSIVDLQVGSLDHAVSDDRLVPRRYSHPNPAIPLVCSLLSVRTRNFRDSFWSILGRPANAIDYCVLETDQMTQSSVTNTRAQVS